MHLTRLISPVIKQNIFNTFNKQFTTARTTISKEEVSKFAAASNEWWDQRGQFNVLHRMNPVRMDYMRQSIEQIHPPLDTHYPLKNMKILDIGCGGGLLSESLARLGASVTGVDAAIENIEMAKYHQTLDPILVKNPIEYIASTAEQLVEEGHQFDVVCALEVLEHVSDKHHFLNSIAKLTKPTGILFVSTINRTPLSYFLTVLLAERVLRMVPNGTHSHDKYVTPQELKSDLQNNDCCVINTTGMQYNPLNNTWIIAQRSPIELQVNYIMTAIKRCE